MENIPLIYTRPPREQALAALLRAGNNKRSLEKVMIIVNSFYTETPTVTYNAIIIEKQESSKIKSSSLSKKNQKNRKKFRDRD